MKRKKYEIPEVRLSVIEEKKAQLELLKVASNDAVGLFTSTVNTIKKINEDIKTQKEDIDSTISELRKTSSEMTDTLTANENLIKRFESFLA